jgi:hypothetical protein
LRELDDIDGMQNAVEEMGRELEETKAETEEMEGELTSVKRKVNPMIRRTTLKNIGQYRPTPGWPIGDWPPAGRIIMTFMTPKGS